MKITREIDGKVHEIELTPGELRIAYDELDIHYKTLDMKSKLLEEIIAIEDLEANKEFNVDKWDDKLPPESEATTDESRKLRDMWSNPDEYGLVDYWINALDQNDNYWESYWIAAECVIDEAREEK